MDLKTLHAADTIRHALAGHILLTKDERYAAVTEAIKKVETSNVRANEARAKGFYHTAILIDRLVDAKMEEIDRLLALPTILDDASDWSLAS